MGALDVHAAKQRSSARSSLAAGRKIMGAGFVSGWFTDVVTIQAFGWVSVRGNRLQPGEPEEPGS